MRYLLFALLLYPSLINAQSTNCEEFTHPVFSERTSRYQYSGGFADLGFNSDSTAIMSILLIKVKSVITFQFQMDKGPTCFKENTQVIFNFLDGKSQWESNVRKDNCDGFFTVRLGTTSLQKQILKYLTTKKLSSIEAWTGDKKITLFVGNDTASEFLEFVTCYKEADTGKRDSK